MIVHLCHPSKRSRLAIHRHHVRTVVNFVGTLDVPDNHLVAIYGRTHARDRSLNAVVIGDLVRPDQPTALFLHSIKIASPIGKVNRVSVHRRRSGNIAARREHPFLGESIDVGRTDSVLFRLAPTVTTILHSHLHSSPCIWFCNYVCAGSLGSVGTELRLLPLSDLYSLGE